MIEGSWKGMKKYLEQEMLCDSLKGRVQYDFTWYPKFGGNSAVFTVCLDDQAVKKFGVGVAYKALNQQGYDLKYLDDAINTIPFAERNDFTDYEFSEALKAYRNQPIEDSIHSENPIVRMFAIVDRRVGKRTLIKLRDMVGLQPEWLKPFYKIRFVSEGIHNPV